ncbi:phytanoyl-CoA dioxygenase family protein [Ferrovibrio sp.]|uniref:phytanoyl-CoA dioxygenase family protein n=1 Tax=Ferrovibrio sp. TaxID=1917215 RepID=UPI00311F3D25
MNISRDQLQFYQDNGYICVPGIFPIGQIDRVRAMIYRLFRKFVPDAAELDGFAEPWNDIAFDRAMCALRASDPKKFGALYDCAQSSLELLQLVTVPNCLDVAAAFLGDKAEDLSFSGLMLRMDVPEDRRNVLTWHQDHAYYPQNLNDGSAGLVYWVALQDTPEDMGALHICAGSQREGLVAPETRDKQDYITTEQRAVPDSAVASYQQTRGVCKKGDVLLMHMDTFHRSGHNTSDRIRFSVIYRFHRMLADDYVPFGLLYQYNPYMMDRAKALAGKR